MSAFDRHAIIRRLGHFVPLLATLTVYLVRLGQPAWDPHGPQIYLFDERYTAFTANRLAEGDPIAFETSPRRFEYGSGSDDLSLVARVEWSHPPGAPLAMAPFILIGGFSAVAVRLAALLAALVTLVAARRIAPAADATWVWIVLASDGMFFIFARTAMPQMLMTAGLVSASAFLIAATRRRRLLHAILAGAAFGFAISVRWTAVPVMVAVVMASAISHDGRGARLLRLIPLVVGVAAIVYLATFIPYLASGHSIADLIKLHRAMWWFHTSLPDHYPQSTSAWSWPLQLRPIYFGSGSVGDESWSVMVLGNRLIWWLMIPAFAVAVYRARLRSISDLVPVAVIAALWLPWIFLGRFGMAYYLLPALPFGVILTARLLRGMPRTRLAIMFASLLSFVLAYPVLAAVPISHSLARFYTSVEVLR